MKEPFKDYFKNYKLIYINEAKKYLSEYWDLINERYGDFKLDLDRPPYLLKFYLIL